MTGMGYDRFDCTKYHKVKMSFADVNKPTITDGYETKYNTINTLFVIPLFFLMYFSFSTVWIIKHLLTTQPGQWV